MTAGETARAYAQTPREKRGADSRKRPALLHFAPGTAINHRDVRGAASWTTMKPRTIFFLWMMLSLLVQVAGFAFRDLGVLLGGWLSSVACWALWTGHGYDNK